jgi:hypothetical protein
MPTVGRHGMPLPGPAHCHIGLVQAAPGFVPTHRKVVSLQLLGHPATPITLLCLGMDRFHTGQQGYLVTIYAWGCVSLDIGIKATAATGHVSCHCAIKAYLNTARGQRSTWPFLKDPVPSAAV